jgi:hypothetical protein
MRRIALALGLALLLSTPGVFAQAIAARAGTTGFGGDFSFPVSDRFGLRANLMGGSISDATTESGVRYDSKLRFNTAMGLLDFFPGAGRFRLSAGVAYNNNRLDLRARGSSSSSSGTIEINDRDYNITDIGPVTGKLRFNKANPYFGVGWGNASRHLGAGLFFSADLGVMIVNPTVRLDANCPSTFTPAQCSQLQSDLREEELQFEDSWGFRSWYPVLSFGIGYRW